MPRDFRRAFRMDRRSRRDARASVDEEMSFHLDEVCEELVREGWSPEDARREALRQFGDLEETRAVCAEIQTRRGREEVRAMRVDELWQDVRYAARTIRGTPGYALLVVATLMFGIAANTTIFSVMNPYLLRPLAYASPDQLVQVNQVNPVTGWDMDRFSYPQYQDWKERTRAFSALGAYSYGVANITGDEGPEQVQLGYVTANLFGGVLGVEPVLGRGFTDAEGRPGGDPVVLLSHALWARRYNSDSGILGRPVTLDGVQRTVVGVMPSTFNFPFGSARLWLPLQESAASDRGRMNLQLVGRLGTGWTADRARDELTGIQSELVAAHPDEDGRMDGVTVQPLRQALNFAWDAISTTSYILLGAVAFVLLLACVNVAGLSLARGSTRAREMAVRVALGARRSRLVRQLLTESLILALLGGALGVLVSYWVVSLLAPVLPEELYRVGDIEIDRTVLLFSLIVTLATPVAFGLWPALSTARSGVRSGLAEGGRGSAGTASRGRRFLVAAQVALAVVLTTGAGLMLRSLQALGNVDLGFDADQVVVTEAILPTDAYPTSAERLAYVDQAVSALQRTPGVVSASAVTRLPLNHEMITVQVAPSDQVGTPQDTWPLAILNSAHPGYFQTMGIALQEGRTFTRLDDGGAAGVVVVSRSLARRLWPGGDAVGETLLAGDGPDAPDAYTVVGVVADVRHADLGSDDLPLQVYRPTLQGGSRRYFLVARTQGPPSALVGPVRAALEAAMPNLPVNVRPMAAVVQENELQWSIGTFFLGIFGLGAILLASLGIYGLISYTVAQRRREVGVRIALGATRVEIRRTVVGDGLRVAGVGLAVGVGLALLMSRLLASALYGVGAFDPITLAGVLTLFLGVAVVASLVPAERASRTDPMNVLRVE